MKPEVGKYYRSRGGSVFGPMVKRDNKTYPFVANGYSFTLDGLHLVGSESHRDLIEQVSVYPLQPFEFAQEIEVSDVNDGSEEYIPATFVAVGLGGGIIGQLNGGHVYRWKFARAVQPKLTRDRVITELRTLKGSVLLNPAEALLERAIDFLEADNE